MINIEERKTEKVVGETSFFISFTYNPNYINIIKQLSGVNYNKNTKEWEVPIPYLSKLLDELCIYDSIDLKLLEDNPQEITNISDIDFNEYKYKPFPYQEEGIKYGLTHNNWLMLLEMGLGKSAISIYIANELKKQNKIEHCLVICGVSSLKNNWRKEIQKFTDLSCIILGEKTRRNGNKYIASIKERAEQLKKPIDEFFVITNIETLRDKEVQKAILKGPNNFDMILIDEIQRLGDQGSAQTQGVLKLTKAKYKIGMTGTLITNNPLNAYAPLKWLGAENSTFTNYKYFYCETGFNGIITGFKNLDLLKNTIEKYSLRKKKDDPDVDLDLPPKTIINEYVDMEDDQAKLYNNIKQGIKDQVDKIELNTTNILAMVSRLRQVTACPSYLTTENISCTKINRAIELAEDIISNNEKVIIFSTFKETVNILADKLRKYNPLIATGGMKDEEAVHNLDTFQEDLSRKLLIGTYKKAGTGFTLTAARYMIFIDIPFTMADYSQAQDRIHRVGASKPVFIYHLITSDTIDERVLEIVETKEALSNYLVDGEITENGLANLRKYIVEEL